MCFLADADRGKNGGCAKFVEVMKGGVDAQTAEIGDEHGGMHRREVGNQFGQPPMVIEPDGKRYDPLQDETRHQHQNIEPVDDPGALFFVLFRLLPMRWISCCSFPASVSRVSSGSNVMTTISLWHHL